MSQVVDIDIVFSRQFVSLLTGRRSYQEPAEGPANDGVTAETQV